MTETTIYTPERIAEVRTDLARFRSRLADLPDDDPTRPDVEAAIADARAWLAEAEVV